MRVVVVGPNIMQSGTTGFHVHAVGCRDVGRPKYRGAEKDVMDVDGVEALARDIYSDHIAESENPSDIRSYVADFTVFPCAKGFR
jgi:hypothetical protein